MSRTDLDQQIDAYLAIREAVGLTNEGRYRLLHNFVAYAQNAGAIDGSPIRAATAVAWAWDDAPATCGDRGRADRLMVVRSFLCFLAAIVPGTEIPASRIMAGATRRHPYIFSDDEMAALISAAARPNRQIPFRPVVLSTLLGLLASTGLRVAEAVRLNMGEVRLGDEHPNLQILQTKFQKSRIVPVHPTVAVALDRYLEQRREHARDGWSSCVFVNRNGGPLDVHTIGAWFAQLDRRNPSSRHPARATLLFAALV